MNPLECPDAAAVKGVRVNVDIPQIPEDDTMRTSTALAAVLIILLAGCAAPPHASNLTPGMAKRTIVKGLTTQLEVMEVFGPPDLVTHRDDQEVWTYDKIRNEVRMSNDVLALIVYARTGQRSYSSSTSTMLIVYFDANDIVQDYRLNTTRF